MSIHFSLGCSWLSPSGYDTDQLGHVNCINRFFDILEPTRYSDTRWSIYINGYLWMYLINYLYTDLVNNSFSLLLGYHEYYGKYTKYVFDHFVRKGVGLFFLALMNCFIITAIIHYIQVCILSTSYRKISRSINSIKGWSIRLTNCFWFRNFIGRGYVSKTIIDWWKFSELST